MRLIDADELAKNFAVPSNELFYAGTVLDYIKEAPTVDAVEVVRCEKCKHKHINYFAKESMIVYCVLHGMSKQPDDFCSYGERGGD